MNLYSDYAAHRTRQVFFDLIALGNIALWVWLGKFVYDLVEELKRFGVEMENAGAGFRGTMTTIGETLGSVPLVGGGIAAPFAQASIAGATLESAGISQQETVHDLAVGLGIGIAVVPTLTILVFWLAPRIRFARRASLARELGSHKAGLDLLAMRALANHKLSILAKISDDPVGAWRRGDRAVLESLANLELRSAGVRVGDKPSKVPEGKRIDR